jgi:hypothetical protein
MLSIYHIGSLRNQRVLEVSRELRKAGFRVFDDWFAAGEKADDEWKAYEKSRGHSYQEALNGWPADHVFTFDKHHIDLQQVGLLTLPAGKSGHLELGYIIGTGRPGYILLDPTDVRWDVMYKFSGRTADGPHGVFADLGPLIEELRNVEKDL